MLALGEQCDPGLDVVGDCTDYGYYKPDGLACGVTCELDFTACVDRCGDHVTNGPETCDGLPPAGQSCADFGRDIGPIGCASGCAPDLRDCGTLGWVQEPGAATGTINGLWGTDLDHLVAVGAAGTVTLRVDGVWTPQGSLGTGALNGVWGTSGNDVYAVGANATIMHFDGTTWSSMPTGLDPGIVLYGIDGHGGEVVAVGSKGTILELKNGVWVQAAITNKPTRYSFNAVDAASMTAVGGTDTGPMPRLDVTQVFRRVNGVWISAGAPSPTGVALNAVTSGDGKIFAAGDDGHVFIYDGTSWVDRTVPVLPPLSVAPLLTGLWYSRPGELFISGMSGFVFLWDGTTFVSIPSGGSRTGNAIFGLDPHHVFTSNGGDIYAFDGTARRLHQADTSSAPAILNAVARYGSIGIAGDVMGKVYVSDDGNTWGYFSGSYASGSVNAIWSDGGYVAIGHGGGLTYFAGGFPSTPATPLTTPIEALAGTAGNLFAAGSAIYHCTDVTGAAMWTTELSGTVSAPVNVSGIWVGPDGTGIATDAGGGVWRRSTSETWTKEDVGSPLALTGVWGADATHIWVIGNDGLLLRYDGTRWRRIRLGTSEKLLAINGTSRSDVFVAGTNGIMFHYDGLSWSQMSSTTTRIQALDAKLRAVTFAADFGMVDELLRSCAPTETRCGDAWDDDCDGLINCEDPDCAGTGRCQQGGACAPAQPLPCGTTVTADTFTGVARLDDLDCMDGARRSPEATYRFIAPTDGAVTITLTADPELDLQLAVAPAIHGGCDIKQCSGSTTTATGRTVTMNVSAGELYYVIVDGVMPTGATFDLALACP